VNEHPAGSSARNRKVTRETPGRLSSIARRIDSEHRSTKDETNMNITQLNRDLAETSTRARGLMQRTQAQADAEGRPMTPTERDAIESLVNEGKAIKARIDRATSDVSMSAAIERMTGDLAPTTSSVRPSLGAEFIHSETFKWLKANRGALPTGSWTSPSSELRATLLDESGGSGGALVVPTYVPGIVPLPTRPLVMSDLFAPGTTDSNLVTFMKETTFTNAAAPVLEGAAKPESTIVFAAASEPVRKIATWIPVTEEMLEDVPSLRSYLDARLALAVQLAEDDQLLNGNNVAPNLNGVLVRAGLAAAIVRGASESNADAILKQIAAIQTATGLVPDGVVINPANWQTILLSKTADGIYISGNGPFATPQQPTLWGLPVAVTPAIVANTALVGAFKTAAQLFRKGGLRVEASNSHASFFVENKIAIRAEERLALALYREAAFGKITGLA
jgi:HK97 family phage major capsid protein